MKKTLLLITFFLLTACARTPPALQPTDIPIQPTATFTAEPTLMVTMSPTPTLTLTAAPSLTPTPVPTLPPGVNNVARVNFFNKFRYHSMSQTFTNREVMGSFETAITLQNISDDSSAPVYGLGLEFSTEPGITIERVREEYLEILGPPVFKWFFGNVPEEPIQNVYGSEASIVPGSSFRAPFTPGFDASISMDKTNFSEPAAQVFTLTIVPRQNFITDFIFHLDGGAYGDAADVVITSLEPGEHIGPAGERITVTLDRKNIAVDTLSLTINEAYSFTMTLQVDPRQPNTTYKPFTAIAWILPGGSDRGTTLGNMLTVQVDKVGIWTWTAIGEYLWEWQGPGTQYGVDFN